MESRTPEFNLIMNALKSNSEIPIWTLEECLYLVSTDIPKYLPGNSVQIIILKWCTKEASKEAGYIPMINDIAITSALATYLNCGDLMCDHAVMEGNKYILEFLHDQGYRGNNEIAMVAHNCNVDFLSWMYESGIKWDDSLQYLDDIKDEKVLLFLKENMEDWKSV